MKLIFVNRFFHPDHSATSQLLSDLAFYLAGQPGYDVLVVTSRQRYDHAGAGLPARERLEGVDVRRVWTTHFGRGRLMGRALDYLSFYLTAALMLWRLARRHDVIVAKTDPPLISVIAGFVARARGAILVNWVQDAFPEVAQTLGVRLPFFREIRTLRNYFLNAARANVVLGQRMHDWARAQGVADERIVIIPNWVDGDAIRPVVHAHNSLRREWGLADKFVVAYSGNLGRAHEFGTLLAAAEVLRSEPDIVFLFIGGGHRAIALNSEARQRGLASICFRPYQPRNRLGESLSVADLHWISLRPELEGLIVPSKIYGVLAAGRPALMVGDPDGEIGQVLRRHECGMTIPIGAGHAMANEILQLRRAPNVREAMGCRARQAYDEDFSPAQAFAAWVTLFARLGQL